MIILRSVGPVISTRRSCRSAGIGATVHSALADVPRLGQEVRPVARVQPAWRSARRRSSCLRRPLNSRAELRHERHRLGRQDFRKLARRVRP